MKIIHILCSNQFSGAENVVAQIVDMFKDSGTEMVYCSPDGPIRKALEERAIPFYPLRDLSSKAVNEILNVYHPDIIHAHDMRASYLVTNINKEIPVVSHIHNNGFSSRRLSLKSIGFLKASLGINHIFWVSKSAYKDYYFRRFVEKKSSVLPNILNMQSLRRRADIFVPHEVYDLVFLGRLQYPKNPQRFVEIVRLLKEKYAEVRCAMIGDGDLRGAVRCLIIDKGLEDNITMLGYQSNPLPVLRASKALVMTSDWEGTPMSALEALGLGVPVVSTPVDGLLDIVRNDYNGFLSDSDHVLVDVLYKILTDDSYYKVLSNGALETSEQLNDIFSYKCKLMDRYNEVLR